MLPRMTLISILLAACATPSAVPNRNAATAAEADAAARAAIVRQEPSPGPVLSQEGVTEPAPLPVAPSAPPVSDTQRQIAAGLAPPPGPAPASGPCRTVQLQEVQHRVYTVRQPDGSVAVQAEPVVGDSRPLRVCPPSVSKVSP